MKTNISLIYEKKNGAACGSLTTHEISFEEAIDNELNGNTNFIPYTHNLLLNGL